MTSTEQERKYFWALFESVVKEMGNPFICMHKTHYATINQSSADSDLCLGLDFLLQKKFFRVGIYIRDDSQTRYFNKLFLQKEEIEKKLGFAPIWNKGGITVGQKNVNTRRVEVQNQFIPYNRDDYVRLIREVLPVIMKFIEVFSVYLPEAFSKNN